MCMYVYIIIHMTRELCFYMHICMCLYVPSPLRANMCYKILVAK